MDYLGVAYQLKIIPPGPHSAIAQKLGAPGSSLPFLVHGDEVIQGSSLIIDWAQKRAAAGNHGLNPDKEQTEAETIERRLDDVTGLHIRRMYYSEALVKYPKTVKPVFDKGLSLIHSIMLTFMWPVVRKRMINLMDLGTEQGIESKKIVESELDWLDGVLADGREYLVGDRFSRVDITAASLLAPLVTPPEHPTYANIVIPPGLKLDVVRWEKRPALMWVKEIYARHRA